MQILKIPVIQEKHRRSIRIFYSMLLLGAFVFSGAFLALIYSKQIAFDLLWYQEQPVSQDGYSPKPFPVSVNPSEKTITQRSDITQYLEKQLSYTTQKVSPTKKTWLTYAIARLSEFSWYQNLASANGRVLVIRPGVRREDITNTFSKILNWNADQAQLFQEKIVNTTPILAEGKFFPSTYYVSKDAQPTEVANMILHRFNAEIMTRYSTQVSQIVPLQEALTLASLLEREAYDFTDMREISGIIWNRLFIDMNLQIDATLQYAKGTNSLTTWYPPVRPDDKYIASEFNTYANQGLPPAPIGNPSVAAVIAALNPIETDCLFYFHDKNSKFFCSKTYKEHIRKLKISYGRGK